MCGRYIVVETVEAIEKRFNVKVDGTQLKMNYNLPVGDLAPVITDENPQNVQFFQFGLTPFWAKKPMYLFNARSEGDHNKEDDPLYRGAKGIIEKPSFRKPIRSQRCLVIASGFIEGSKTEGLDKPFLVYLKDKKRPFALAGIWDTWMDETKDELLHSFAIITTTANDLLQKVGHHRMPVILSPDDERAWLKTEAPLTIITHLLEQYPPELMNAYPISPEIKHKANNFKELLQPIGERIYPEYEIKTTKTFEQQGFGHRKKQKGDSNWGDRFKKD